MTRSAGHTGLIFSGSPPRVFTASRMAAKSTTAGTPLARHRVARNKTLTQETLNHYITKKDCVVGGKNLFRSIMLKKL